MQTKLSGYKKLIVALLVITFVFQIMLSVSFMESKLAVFAWDGVTASEPVGAGSQNDPYLIDTAEELFWVSNKVSEGYFNSYTYFELTNNIDLGDEEWLPIGTEDNKFYGNFDGNRYTIANVSIASGYNYYGLFGYVTSSTIKNLKVSSIDFDIDLDGVTEEAFIGGVAAYIENSTIQTVRTTGNIRVQNGTQWVLAGGIVGYAEGIGQSQTSGTINNVYNKTAFNITNSSSVALGGVVGRILNGKISNSFNQGNLIAETTVGLRLAGIAALATESSLYKVFNEANLIGTSEEVYIGGIGAEVLDNSQQKEHKFMYNLGDLTATATGEIEPFVYAGGLFANVYGNNSVSYAYNAGDFNINSENFKYLGALIGSLEENSSLSFSYYKTIFEGDVEAIAINNGSAPMYIDDLSETALKSSGSYGDYNGVESDWKFNGSGRAWVWSGNLNNGYPMLRYVGNYSVSVQKAGNGTVSGQDGAFYKIGTAQIYSLKAGNGYELAEIIYDTSYSNEEINDYKGDSSVDFQIKTDGLPVTSSQQLLVRFVPVPFVKTQLFWYLAVVSAIIILMIVGTVIINYRYAMKMDKIMTEKKKALSLNADKALAKENKIKMPKKRK